MKFRAYIVEDSPTIRDNLIETLQELALVDAVGTAETEHEGKQWLAQNDAYWDLALKAVSGSAKTLDVTLALPKTETVEFLAPAERAPAAPPPPRKPTVR